MSVLNNVQCRWASIQEPNRSKEYGDKWEIEALISEAQAKEFSDQGATTKKDDEGQWTIRIKRSTKGQRRDGGTFDKEAPRCVDMNKQPFTQLIGNGSTVNIAYTVKKWTRGTQVDLVAVQVVNHIPYGGKGSDPLAEFDGESPVVNDDDIPF